jgi:DNA-binding NarL/FixJ family response regulator
MAAGGAQVGEVSVLVVDDQPAFRQAMATVVAATDGFVLVGSAASGEEALEVARAVRPRLVLMDVHLPGIDGVEAARRLRAGDPAPVVVLLSTYEEDEVELDGCGAAAYVPKRLFGPDRLVDCWSRACS